jgi:spectinomycin phosphotransferase
LNITQVTFLPLGADHNTAVYRVDTDNGKAYFLKLRSGVFDETSVALPRLLSDQGITQIVPPLTTKSGRLWGSLDAYKVILYPYVKGDNGYAVEMSTDQWIEFGAAIKKIHSVELPPTLFEPMQQEKYSSRWRELGKAFQDRVERDVFEEPVSGKLSNLLRDNREVILDLVRRAEQLAEILQARSPEFVLCHSDIHAGNILIEPGDTLYIVDWDEPILAPKERDLMFIGVKGFLGRSVQEEETLFYQGYGQTEIDPAALAYYRYERIVQDIASYSEFILSSDEGGEDREQSFEYLKSNFLPNSTIEIVYQTDRTWRQH